jgi:hypothetical protein
MKKILVLFIGLILGAIQTSNAQVEFMHSVGATIYASGEASGITGTWSPRLNLLKVGEDGALSAGTHFSLGGSVNSRTGGSISFDFPIMAEINMGHAATKESKGSFGYFAGIGYGFSALTSDVAVQSTSGPVIDAGIRFLIAEKNSVGLRVSYLITGNPGYPGVLGLGVSYNLGVVQ